MTFRPSITFKTAVTDKLRLLLPSVAVVTILWGVSSALSLVNFLIYSPLALLSAKMVTKLIIQMIEFYHFIYHFPVLRDRGKWIYFFYI